MNRHRLFAAVIVCLFLLVPAAALAADPDLERRIDRLEQQMNELQVQLRALAAAPAGGSSAATIEELSRKIDVLAEELQRLRGQAQGGEPGAATPVPHGMAPGAGKVYGVSRGVSIGGYGELLYQDFDGRRDDGEPSGKTDEFDLLRAIVYVGYKFNDKILFNSELEWEHATSGEGEEEKGEISVEFAYVDFLLDPRINARAGLLLVPVGLINELHEAPVFLGARRPDVETAIIPTTWRENGAGLHGDLGPFSYKLYLLNGLDSSEFSASSGIRGGRQQGSKAKAADLAVATRVDLTGVPGLLAGVSWYRGGSSQDRTAFGMGFDGTVELFDVHADFKWRGLQLRGLYAEVTIDDAGVISVQNEQAIGKELGGWYLEAGYDLLARTRFNDQALIPFVRREALDTQRKVARGFEPLVTGANDRTVTTYGVVYKPIPQIAVKVDYQDYHNEAGTAVDQFNAALGWLF